MPATRATEFDAYVAVDWSANSKPKTGADSIWIAWGKWHRGRLSVGKLENPSTRSRAMVLVTDLLKTLVSEGARVLAGFDFAYGYPGGLAKALSLGGSTPGWLAVWNELDRLIQDQSNNQNNRFEAASALNGRLGCPGPFWGCPSKAATATLSPRKGTYPHRTPSGVLLDEYRLVDQHLRATGRMVQSPWKLFYVGSVGSQALLGIPCLAHLVHDPSLRERSRVWPFETGFRLPKDGSRPGVVHVEIWPGLFKVDLAPHQTKDAAQVLSVVAEFADLDARGSLAPLFTPQTVPAGQFSVCQNEQGWIFGA